MSEIKKYDAVVIGGGSGGLAFAKRAAGYGKKVAVIEKSRIGGTCVNVGCMPKKVMFNASSLREMIKLANSYGFTTTETFDWSILKKKRDEMVTRLNGNHHAALDRFKVDFYSGFGHFIGPHQVQIDDGIVLESEMILIATGGKPMIPDFPGKEYCGTSDTFWDLDKAPTRSLVVGGGYIAVEMAGILETLGSETYLACRYDTPLRSYDPFIINILMEEMRKRGVTICDHSVMDHVTKKENGKLDCYFKNGNCVNDVDFL